MRKDAGHRPRTGVSVRRLGERLMCARRRGEDRDEDSVKKQMLNVQSKTN